MDIGDKVVDIADSVSGVVKQSDNTPVEDFKFYDLSEVDEEVAADEPEVELASAEAAIPTPATVTESEDAVSEAAEESSSTSDEEFFTENDIVEEEATAEAAADDDDIWSDSL